MPYADLREFIDRVEREGELARVKAEVDLNYEVGAICHRNYDFGADNNSKALVFEKPKGYDTPLVVNLLGTYRRYAMAIDTTPENFTKTWKEKTANPIAPVMVKTGPCKENIHIGEEVNLFDLPIPIWNEKDGGPFITLPHQITKDPETGQSNLGMYRAQLHDKRILGIRAWSFRHINVQWRKAHSRGESLPVAVVVGVDPAITLASIGSFPYGVDELAMAGALRGKAIEMVRCETIPLAVPASAEWVLEGEVRPNSRRKEGPFGEAAGYYGGPADLEFIDIKAITHRNNPIHNAAYLRKPPSEEVTLRHCWEAEAFSQCSHLQGLLKLNFPQGGCNGLIAIASIKKTFDGQGKMVGMGILGEQAGRSVKIVIVVDDDIDPFNMTEVLWAMATRFQPEQDADIIKVVSGFAMDPSIPMHSQESGTNLVSKMIIDATKPIRETFAEVISPKKDVLEKVKKEWAKYGIT